MDVLILGASGRIGRLVTHRCLDQGHRVTTLVRSAPPDAERDPSIRVVVGDATDPSVLEGVMNGLDGVISALGPRANSIDEELALERAMQALVRAMEGAGVRRLITLSGAGISVPGDRKPALDRVASAIVRRLARHVVGAKQREFEVFSRSSIEWTAVRPPLVRDGPAVGYRLDLVLRPGARVTREDAAAAIADQLVDRTFIRQAPFVLPPR